MPTYKILIKTTGKTQTFYKFYEKTTTDDSGTSTTSIFETDDQDVLETELLEIYKTNGTDNIVVIQDVTTTLDVIFS